MVFPSRLFSLLILALHHLQESEGGNELTTALHFFDNFRGVAQQGLYDGEYNSCFSSKMAPMWCWKGVNSKYKPDSLWTPTDLQGDARFRKDQDCDYAIHLSKASRLTFHFFLEQHSCKHRLEYLQLGGATFDIYAYTFSALVSCALIDAMNDKYHVTCRFPNAIVASTDTPRVLCVQLTVLLLYEHYDAYSEVLATDGGHDYLYPPMGKPIVDNKTFCAEETMEENHSLRDWNGSSVNVESGFWQSNESSRQNDSLLMSWQVRNREKNYSKCDDLFCPQLKVESPDALANKFQYVPTSILENASPNSVQVLIGTTNSTRHYYLVGSSHMRYFFDGLVEFFFGTDVLPSERKHDDADEHNFHLRHRLFIHDVADALLDICSLHKNSSHKNTIVLQFGAWDLMYSSLRRLLWHPHNGQKLISSLSSVLNGSHQCIGVNHIIWITSMPYPYCIEDGSACFFWQNFKNNAAISASNQFFTEKIKNLPPSPHIRISIVDAYSIIKPRLIFRYENEVVCANHFLCRMTFDGKLAMVQTPGGKAVLESIVRALLLH